MTSASRILASVCAAAFVFASGCQIRQDMADQPKYKPLAATDFFADGRSERPLIDNTVAHGSIGEDALFISKESNAFPVELTPELMQRGKQRYGIFCTPCHGIQGDGNGMVAMRGMKHPPTFHSDRLRKVPNGYLFDVVTSGFGGMLSYSAQIPPRDRWAIIAYVRALQLSRNAPVSELPSDLRDKLNTLGTGGAAK